MPLRKARLRRFVRGVVGAALTSLIMPTGKLQRKRELPPQVNSLREGLRATDALRAQGLLGLGLR